MRTTLTLDNDVAKIAKTIARENNQSMGAVISGLVKKGLQAGRIQYSRSTRDDLPVFRVREDSPVITLPDVKRAEDEA